MSETEASSLAQFDPEIERTSLKRRREAEEVKRRAEMGDQRSLRELWIPKDRSMVAELAPPVIQANNFELKPALITMVQHNQFSGSPREDPHEHIRNFLEYCNTLKHNGVTPEAIRMQLFPFSLRDGAKMWLHSLPLHLRDTWEHLLQTFFERYFPPTRAADLRDKIIRFAQYDGESLYDAWQRYQGLLRMCPNHGQEKWLIMQTLCKGLSSQTRSYVDSAAGGGIMNKTLDEAFDLIESMASHNFSWSNERAIQPQNPGMYQVNANDEIALQVEVLNKQMASILGTQGNSSNQVNSCSSDVCQICGITGHTTLQCEFSVKNTDPISEVNYAQNNSPYS